jgi:hypothetical protein
MTLRIKESVNNIIRYICDCGVIGQCLIKPLSKEGDIIVDVSCVECGETRRVKLSNGNTSSDEFSWALTILNEALDEREF